MPVQRHVIMAASENASLIAGKAGGVADVVSELPLALAENGWKCTILVPSYGFLHKRNTSSFLSSVEFPFRGYRHTAEFWEATSKFPHPSVRIILVHHPWISGEPIYFNDPSDQPFARDASKYALFSSAIGQYLRDPKMEGILHLHDWHVATLLLLRSLHPEFTHLNKFKTIFTIHNLGLQGIRPMRNHDSSLEAWFPELFHNLDWVNSWKDPRYDWWFYTPMDIGIRAAERVNTVSESYAQEILRPSNSENGFAGGEGLEVFLQQINNQGRLFGILNGCAYPQVQTNSNNITKNTSGGTNHILDVVSEEVHSHRVDIGGLSFKDGLNKLEWLKRLNINLCLTSVTRVTDQKMRLLCEKDNYSKIAFDSVASILNENNGLYVILGSGTSDYEWYLSEASRYHERIIFVRGFSEKLSQELYKNGTLFLMPSLYEPCGISQMLAMREGQPCIVHGVGGLKDTVLNNVNGFVFEGWTMNDKVNNLIGTVRHAVNVALHEGKKWESIKTAAHSARFDWATAAKKYEKLYVE